MAWCFSRRGNLELEKVPLLTGCYNKRPFRGYIGSSDSNTLKFWEPNAPNFAERVESLKHAFSEGYQTSVSCEPMLDDNIGDVINQVSSFVTDFVWIGKANQLLTRLSLNGENDSITIRKAKELMEWQRDQNIKQLYFQYKDNPMIKWKESVRKVVGIRIPAGAGLDV